MPALTRRGFVSAGVCGLSSSLGACAAMRDMPVFGVLFEGPAPNDEGPVRTPDYAKVYARLEGEKHPVTAFDFTNTDPLFLRANVGYRGPEPEGTLVLDPNRYLLYLVEAGGRATRYGIGIGPDARGFSGRAVIVDRREWPDDLPAPAGAPQAWSQLRSAPDAPRPKGRPAGARALLAGQTGREAFYAIHGTPDPASVGSDAAQGGIRLINQDVVDLYGRTAVGAPLVVLSGRPRI